jgi:hypothetical protein
LCALSGARVHATGVALGSVLGTMFLELVLEG